MTEGEELKMRIRGIPINIQIIQFYFQAITRAIFLKFDENNTIDNSFSLNVV